MAASRAIEKARRIRRGRGLALGLVLLGLAGGCGDSEPASRSAGEAAPAPEPHPDTAEAWKEQRAELDATVWAPERAAGEHERAIVALWDALIDANRRGDEAAKRDALAALQFDELRVGTPQAVGTLDHGIQVLESGPPYAVWSGDDWRRFLDAQLASGYRLVQSEWHHSRFTPGQDGSPDRSGISFAMDLVDGPGDRRIHLSGDLDVEWSGRRDARGVPIPARIDATHLRMLIRPGPPPFREILSWSQPDPEKPEHRSPIHPVLVYDLDRDGLAEIVMVRAGKVLWNRGGGRFEAEPLLAHPTALTETGVIADLNGDGLPDLASTRPRGDLVVYFGDVHGRFPDPPRSFAFDYPLRAPSVLSVGDIDGDGDLDLWVAQYKPAYLEGQMPTPFYDANDGYPAHLLQNDGHGGFRDVTEEAGLAPRRKRRTYTSSFADLDEDGDLDLLVVSDYAGIDLYSNDGSGHFVDANDSVAADRHLFGMSASFADYDLDGHLDFFVAGMASTTARRLEALGLGREDRPDIQAMRMRMAFGNRMYLAGKGGWHEPEFAGDVARTGWTWGTTAFDFDNDGDPDLFAANGHESGKTTNDYCSTFWTHDIYDGASQPDPGLGDLFQESIQRFVEGNLSWDGYQKNRLLMNRSGHGFVEVGFPMGVADEFDSRSAVSEDLDRDGRVDLVVVEDEGLEGQTLHVYRNTLETGNGWIGVELQERAGGLSPVGAVVRVRTPGRVQVSEVVTGETLMGQHSTTLHFGLGTAQRVESIEVRWPGGATLTLKDPEPGRYHRIRAPDRPAPSGGV
jgi:hypothetical protein